MATSTDYAARIRSLRKRLNLTQNELAEHLGVSYVSISRWENNQNQPSALAWDRFCELEAERSTTSDGTPEKGRDFEGFDFEGGAEEFRAFVHASRLRFAHQYNPAFASEISRIDPLPHQRIAVYERMLEQPRLRFLLADDAGAGKTIMSGLYIREMLARRLLRRILIVPPAGLVGNWRRELEHLFSLSFNIVSGADARAGNPFAGPDSDRLIVSVDTLAADAAFGRLADEETEPYDLVIFDEAHKLSVRKETDGSLTRTQRYHLAEAVAGVPAPDERWELPWEAHHLLLLTATPHMGKEFPYYGLWRLLEPDVLSTLEALHTYPRDARRRHFIRRTKEEMVDYHGEPIYPTRVLDTLSYELSPAELALYEDATDYLDHFYNQAGMLNRSAVHLAKSVFQRRLASSTYALLQSFRRRAQKLADLAHAVREAQLSEADITRQQREIGGLTDIFETKTADEERARDGREESEHMEDEVLAAVASASLDALEEEHAEVLRLVDHAEEVYAQGGESKFQRLLELMEDEQYAGEKMLIFTEHRDTLSFILKRLQAIGYTGRLAQIHGGMPHEERDEEVERFRTKMEEGGAQYLVATDAAGEGINLQFCWLMVNYDVPWNPARLEQRMGRIHRYGQDHDPVIVVNLVSSNTREDRVQRTLLDKLEIIRKELGSDKVFDVVGEVLQGLSIREYIDRVMAGESEEVISAEIDARITTDRVREIQKEQERVYGSGDTVLDRVPELKEELEREKFRRLLPGEVQQFLARAMPILNLEVKGDLDGYFRLTPAKEGALQPFWPMLESYPEKVRGRMTTHKPSFTELCLWLHPGEALFDRLQAVAEDHCRLSAERGAIFADPTATEPYLLYFVTYGVRRAADDNLPGLSAPETRGRRFTALRTSVDGSIAPVDPKHLQLLSRHEGSKRPALEVIAVADTYRDEALRYATHVLAREWSEELQQELSGTAEERAQFLRQGYQLRKAELAERRVEVRDQIRNEVPGAKERYQRIKADQTDLHAKEAQAVATVMREPELLEAAEPEFIACAAVVPSTRSADQQRRDKEVERIAMREARAFEEARGATVRDVSTPDKAHEAGLKTDWPGYDLLSTHPDTGRIGIEVKGRARVGKIVLHENEWQSAINHREDYWLYVVFDCGTSQPRLYRVQDPFAAVESQPVGGVVIDSDAIQQGATR